MQQRNRTEERGMRRVAGWAAVSFVIVRMSGSERDQLTRQYRNENEDREDPVQFAYVGHASFYGRIIRGLHA